MDMENQEAKQRYHAGLFTGLGAGILLSAAVMVIIFFIFNIDAPKKPSNGANSSYGDVVVGESDLMNAEFIHKINEIYEEIQAEFYLSEVTDEQLREGMYDGLVYALDDVYSTYYTEEELDEVLSDTEGVYYGIGAYVEMDMETGYVLIHDVIEGTPAEAAGLQAGDIFYKVNGEDVTGLDSTQVVSKVKGEEGSFVQLTMIRGTEEIEFEIERKKIENPSVEYEMLEDQIGYLNIMQFDDLTVENVEIALADLTEQGMEALVIDLRGNPGGGLYSVVEITDMFISTGVVLYTEDKSGYKEYYEADDPEMVEVPMVVLIDGGSASAAEVMAGALKDYEVATIVGTTSFGKGIVQSLILLDDNSGLKLTTSAYFTPNGTDLHGIGITPDIEVEFDAELYEQGIDNQLEEAITVVTDLLN